MSSCSRCLWLSRLDVTARWLVDCRPGTTFAAHGALCCSRRTIRRRAVMVKSMYDLSAAVQYRRCYVNVFLKRKVFSQRQVLRAMSSRCFRLNLSTVSDISRPLGSTVHPARVFKLRVHRVSAPPVPRASFFRTFFVSLSLRSIPECWTPLAHAWHGPGWCLAVAQHDHSILCQSLRRPSRARRCCPSRSGA
jgi:hypothetical protein